MRGQSQVGQSGFAYGDTARRLRCALLAGTALTFAVLPAGAQTAQTWNGNTSTDWFTGTNWDSGSVPSAGPPQDSVTLDTVTPSPTVASGTALGYSAIDLSNLNVGFTGTGSLTVNNGASFTVTNGNAVIGGDLLGIAGSSANGSVLLDGAGTTFTVTGTPPTNGMLVVGGSGTGAFTVQNGAVVSTVDSYVGHLAGSTGTATVTGTGSQWNNSGSSTVGNLGTGVFNVLNGADVTVTSHTFVGADSGGSGTINISGAGSSWTTGVVTVLGGSIASTNGGSGTINVSNGGNYTAHNLMVLGYRTGGTGHFNVSSGGTVTVDSNANVYLGFFADNTGTITIDGAGSVWDATAAGEMVIGGNTSAPGVGNGGTGVVNVVNGGAMNMQGSLFLGRGETSGGTGTLNVNGAGSAVSLTTALESLFVGVTGTGAVNISNGGRLTNDGIAYLGFYAGSTGVVTVDGAGSTWTSNGLATIIGGNDASAAGGTGTVTVRNGGTFNTGAAYLGFDLTGTAVGTVNVTGAGSIWNAGDVYVGYSGSGTINITNGGTVNTGALSIGECTCAVGAVNVSGGSTLSIGNNLTIADFGAGTMTVSGNGTTVNVVADLVVGLAETGALTIQNGAALTAYNAILGLNPGASFGTVNVTGTGSALTINNNLTVGFGFDGGALNILDGGRVDVTNLITSDGRITVGAGSALNGGSLLLNSTATTTFGLRGTSAGQINLGSGTATLSGALVVTGHNVGRTTYTLVHSANLGGSTFSTVTYADALLRNPVLTYTAGDVLLTVDPYLLTSLLPTTVNANQRNVAQAIDNALAGGATPSSGFESLFFLSGDALLNALTQLSGEIGTAPTQAGFAASNQFMNVLFEQGGIATGGGFGPIGYAAEKQIDSRAAEAYAAVTPRDRRAVAPDFTSRWGVWGSGYGGNATVKGDGGTGSSETTSRVYGMAAGAEYRFTLDTVAGFALGGAGSNFSIDGGSGRADIFQAGAYVRHRMGAAYLSGGLAYGWQRVTTDRTVTVSGTDRLEASFNAQTFAARLEGGYRFATPWVGLTPYAALQSTSFFMPSYAESAISGSNQFALSYGSQTTTNVRTELGMRVDKTFVVAEGVFALNGRAAWAHDSNTDRLATATFQTLPGATFTVNGATPAADGALLSAGAEMTWTNGFTLAGTFEGEFSNTTASYAGRGTLKYAW